MSVYTRFYYKTKPKPEVPIYDYISHSFGGNENVSNLAYMQRVPELPIPRTFSAENTCIPPI